VVELRFDKGLGLSRNVAERSVTGRWRDPRRRAASSLKPSKVAVDAAHRLQLQRCFSLSRGNQPSACEQTTHLEFLREAPGGPRLEAFRHMKSLGGLWLQHKLSEHHSTTENQGATSGNAKQKSLRSLAANQEDRHLGSMSPFPNMRRS
jgi:hypothetical protein